MTESGFAPVASRASFLQGDFRESHFPNGDQLEPDIGDRGYSAMKKDSFIPVVIIGAGRSGTNILRDTLVRVPGFGTWPCDEINYIWRHGNVRWPTDEFSTEHARPEVKAFIRRAFEKLAVSRGLSHVVEKTCANSLRVAFVNAILPDAKFIHIIRDGRDVVSSAQKRWTARLDLPYVMAKARFVPISDVPYYASRYLWNRIYMLSSGEKRLAFWGPRFRDLDDALRSYPLEEVCALQWMRCVEKAEDELASIEPSRVHRVHYEDFVSEPAAELKKIIAFLGLEKVTGFMDQWVAPVKTDSVGKGKREMKSDRMLSVENLMKSTLNRLGYA